MDILHVHSRDAHGHLACPSCTELYERPFVAGRQIKTLKIHSDRCDNGLLLKIVVSSRYAALKLVISSHPG